MKYLILLMFLFTGCDQISKEECWKSCNKLCDSKIESMKKVDLYLGCEQGCHYSITPCVRIGGLVGWGKNEIVAYCLHIFHDCQKVCKIKYSGEYENDQEEKEENQDL